MSAVTAMGLGLMGSALARALVAGGQSVTVWNRTAEKARPLVALGAAHAATVVEAVEASPVVIVCVDNYETTLALLGGAGVVERLRGRTLVQLTTGTPAEARHAEAFYTSSGAEYLDGVVLSGPEDVGGERTRLVYSGRREVFDRLEATLKLMGGDSRFVGENPGAAEAIDFAWLTELFGVFAATAHGALICEAEGVDLETYASMFGRHDTARWIIDVIRNDAFADPGAKMQTWYESALLIQKQARDAAINSDVPDFVAGLLAQGVAAGHGAEHIAALVKVLRAGRS